MERNIIDVDKYNIKANVEKNVCPLNWLAEFYREYPGKLVMVDKNLMAFLLNNSHADEILENKHDGYKQGFSILWKATDEFPETRIQINSYGKDVIEKNNDYSVESDTNYYVIEELYADDILINGSKYAENMLTDEQIIYLVSRDLSKQDVLER